MSPALGGSSPLSRLGSPGCVVPWDNSLAGTAAPHCETALVGAAVFMDMAGFTRAIVSYPSFLPVSESTLQLIQDLYLQL